MIIGKHNRQFILSLLLLIIVGNCLSANTQQQKERIQNSWDKVSTLYLPSLINKEDKQKMLANLDAMYNNTGNQHQMTQEELQQQMQDLQTIAESEEIKKALTPNETNYTRQVLAHLANTPSDTPNLHEESTAIFDDTTYRDLTIFCGKEESPAASFFNLVDRTQTISGKTALLDILYNPLTDIKALSERQAAIIQLVNDEELYASIEKKLASIKNAEHTLFIMLNEIQFKLITKMTERFYLKNVLQLPPQTTFILTPLLATLATHFPIIDDNLSENELIRTIQLSIASALIIECTNKGLTYLPFIKRLDDYLCTKINKITPILEAKNFFKYFIQLIYAPYYNFNNAYVAGKNAYTSYNNNTLTAGPIFNGIFALTIPPLTAFAFYKDCIEIIDQTKSENMLHDAIGQLAQMTTALKGLQNIVTQNHALTNNIPFKDFAKESNEEFKSFLELLESENFKTPATWTTPKGKMMAALKYLCTLKYEFMPPYIQAGKIDALMSIATLHKQHKAHPNARYHFANYEQLQTPHLALNEFWNPFINPDTVVTNSLELGTKTAHRNMLITGPNAGGKSTALKAIAFAVLMAQTLTIANANITITPFTKVFTTLNITDTTGKESLYQADETRIKQVITTIERLKPSEFALLISDEMFNSTGASHGAALFYSTLSYIDKEFKNALFAAATHFENLVELEADTNGSVANFRVEEATQGANGKMKWTYKLYPGINTQNISFELAQEDGFNPKLLETGKEFLQRHKPPTHAQIARKTY